MAPKLKTYRVYVEQVDQTYVHVKAASMDEAREKGYAKWLRDEAHSYVSSVECAEEDSLHSYQQAFEQKACLCVTRLRKGKSFSLRMMRKGTELVEPYRKPNIACRALLGPPFRSRKT